MGSLDIYIYTQIDMGSLDIYIHTQIDMGSLDIYIHTDRHGLTGYIYTHR